MNSSIRVENILTVIFVLYLLANVADWIQTNVNLDPRRTHPCIVQQPDGSYSQEMRSHERKEVMPSQNTVADVQSTTQH